MAACQSVAALSLPLLYVLASRRLTKSGADEIRPKRLGSFWERTRFALTLWPTTVSLFLVYFSEYALQSGVWAASPRRAYRHSRRRSTGRISTCTRIGYIKSKSSCRGRLDPLRDAAVQCVVVGRERPPGGVSWFSSPSMRRRGTGTRRRSS